MKKTLKGHLKRLSDVVRSHLLDSVSVVKKVRLAVPGCVEMVSMSKVSWLVAIMGVPSVVAGSGGGTGASSPIEQFTVSPAMIAAGQAVKLSWRVSGAEDVSLSGVTATPTSFAVIMPSRTTTFTLKATVLGQSFTKNVTVSVTANPSIANAIVDPSHPGTSIAAGYIGFSHEWGQAQLLMGDPSIGINPIYRQLLTNLSAFGNGPISIRVGGDSTDFTEEPVANTVTPFIRLFQDLTAPVPGVSFILGVNFGANNAALATDQVKQYIQRMPLGSIQAIEIGNEPDFYSFKNHRPITYSFSQYASEFKVFATSIFNEKPNSPLLMGPSDGFIPGIPVSGAGNRPSLLTTMLTTDNLSSLLWQSSKQIGIISQHAYVGISSNASGPSPVPGILLEPSSSKNFPALVAPYADIAKAAGKTYRIGEMNSIADSGQDGISNAFEASLWAPDIMFEFAKIGVSGVNFHSNNWDNFKQWEAYAAFHFNVPQSQYRAANTIAPPPGTQFSSQYSIREIQPLYYGILFFAEATPHHASLLPVVLNTSANLKVWATLDPTDGDVNVAILNKDKLASGSIQLTVPGYSSGVVKRMLAPSFGSKRGISLAGQTFDDSQDGKPRGIEFGEVVSSQSGKFEIAVGPTSALLLTLKR